MRQPHSPLPLLDHSASIVLPLPSICFFLNSDTRYIRPLGFDYLHCIWFVSSVIKVNFICSYLCLVLASLVVLLWVGGTTVNTYLQFPCNCSRTNVKRLSLPRLISLHPLDLQIPLRRDRFFCREFSSKLFPRLCFKMRDHKRDETKPPISTYPSKLSFNLRNQLPNLSASRRVNTAFNLRKFLTWLMKQSKAVFYKTRRGSLILCIEECQ